MSKNTTSLKFSPLFIISQIILTIILISKVTAEQAYNSYSAPFQLFAYILIFNIAAFLFYEGVFPFLQKKTKIILWGILGVFTLYVYIISFYPVMELNGDNAAYLTRAKAMIDGLGFRNMWMPNEPFEATLKSIGFSILNIPFILLFGINNAVGVQLLPLLSVFGGLYFMYRFFENKIEKEFLVILLITVALHSQVIHFSSISMTESSAFFFIFLLFFLTEKYLDIDSKLSWQRILIVMGIAFLAFFAFTVREAIIVLPGTIALFLLIRKRWKEAFLFILFTGLFFASYFAYSSHLKELNEKLGLVQQGANTFSQQSFVQYYIKLLLDGIKTFNFQSVTDTILVITQKIAGNPDRSDYSGNLILNILILLVVLLPLIHKGTKKAIGLSVIFFFSLIIIIIYSWGGATLDRMVFSRYYYPLIPFILFFFLKGLISLSAIISERFKFSTLATNRTKLWVVSIPLLLLLIFEFSMNTNAVYNAKNPFSPPIKDFVNACSWINKNTPKDAVIANRKSGLAYIWAGRKSIHFYNADKFDRYMIFSQNFDLLAFEKDTLEYYKNNKVKYVIIDAFLPDGYNRIVPVMQKNPKNFILIYRETSSPKGYPTLIVKTTNL